MVDGIKENIFLVNAPAGSGKTTKIRKMIEIHLRENPVDNILCITYTNRAADELGKNIDSANVYFGTIHSFINDFISSFFSHQAVIDLYWEVYREKISMRIENGDGRESVKESNERFIEKHGKLDEETVYNSIQSISYNEAPYNSLYRGALSHDDLISFTRIVVDRYPVIKRKIADKYQLIFIDEYQDTSADILHIFYEAVKERDSKMYLLGDRMQQIYRTYDGSFEKEFLTLNRSMSLNINYRTTPYMVSVLNAIYNDRNYEQVPYEKNVDEAMSYLPEVVIAEFPEQELARKREIYPNALVLYLLNKSRFCSIGAELLYDAIQKMDKYGFGRKYGVVDVLTNFDDTNPDKLFYLLFFFAQINLDYKSGLYGRVFSKIRRNKKILNVSKYLVKKHADKRCVKTVLDNLLNTFENGEAKIGDFLLYLKTMDMVNAEYLDEIVDDIDYSNVLQVKMREFHNIVEYIRNPHISTQHGVKGESHDTVIFMAGNSNREPVVYMSRFLELWSCIEVSLPEFEAFYYAYKKLLDEIVSLTGVKCSDIKKENYDAHGVTIYDKIKSFSGEYSGNGYYKNLLEPVVQKYLEKNNMASVKDCLKENLVYGPLSAYKLFYVGCSRARKNLTIIVSRKDILAFKEQLIKKLNTVGFSVRETGGDYKEEIALINH